MNEIYWITRLDTLQSFLILFATIFVIIAIVNFYIVKTEDANSKMVKSNKKYLRTSLPLCILFIVATTLTPSTREAYQIYGIGGTIDYLKTSREAKQLPDKTIRALNCFLDKICEQKNDTIVR